MRPTIYIPSRVMRLLGRLVYPAERGVYPISRPLPEGARLPEVEPCPAADSLLDGSFEDEPSQAGDGLRPCLAS
jgi:hypothetical protein